MGAAISAFADWWAVDEAAARKHAALVISRWGGDFRRSCAELGLRANTVMCGRLRLTPCARFLLAEARRVRRLREMPRLAPETRVSDPGMMGRR